MPIGTDYLYERIRELLGCKRNDYRWMQFLLDIAETPRLEDNDSIFENCGFTIHGHSDSTFVAVTLQIRESDKVRPFVGRLPFSVAPQDRSMDFPAKLGADPTSRGVKQLQDRQVLEDEYFIDGFFVIAHFESDSDRLIDIRVSLADPEKLAEERSCADRLLDSLMLSIATWHNRARMAVSVNQRELALIALEKKWQYEVQLAKIHGSEPPPKPQDPGDLTPLSHYPPPGRGFPPDRPMDNSRVPKKPLPEAGSGEVALSEPEPQEQADS